MPSISLNSSSQYIDSSQKFDVMFLCFLAAFITGGFSPVIGLVSPEIAQHYNVKVSHIVYFDILNLVGLILGNYFSSKLLLKLGGYKTLIISVICGITALWLISSALPLYIYGFCALLNGVSIGFLVPAVSQSIIACFSQENKSTSQLSILNFFFGAGACVAPIIGGFLTATFSWRMVFLSLGFVYLLILISCIFFKFKEKENTKVINKNKSLGEYSQKLKVINPYVLLIGFAIIFYVYIEYIVSYWFSPYLQLAKNIDVQTVGYITGSFWGTVAVFRLLVGVFILPNWKPSTYILITSLIVLAGFVGFLSSDSINGLWFFTIILGIGCSSLFPTLLSFGISQAEIQSPRITVFLIMCGSFGGGLSLFFSAFFGDHLSKVVPIFAGPFLAIFIILLTLYVHKKNNKHT